MSTRKTSSRGAPRRVKRAAPASVLTIDVGGSNVKVLVTGQVKPRRFKSGSTLAPSELVQKVTRLAAGWTYDVVSIGIPTVVGPHGPREEPGNLGPGWVAFDFAVAFERPVKIVNDAAMQALGSYDGGCMLFLGLGTGLGSALISDNVIVPLELGELPYRGPAGSLASFLGRAGLSRLGKKKWRREVSRAAGALLKAFRADYLVLGGGNARELDDLPPGVRIGHNQSAFRGGYRLWGIDTVEAVATHHAEAGANQARAEWRVL